MLVGFSKNQLFSQHDVTIYYNVTYVPTNACLPRLFTCPPGNFSGMLFYELNMEQHSMAKPRDVILIIIARRESSLCCRCSPLLKTC